MELRPSPRRVRRGGRAAPLRSTSLFSSNLERLGCTTRPCALATASHGPAHPAPAPALALALDLLVVRLAQRSPLRGNARRGPPARPLYAPEPGPRQGRAQPRRCAAARRGRRARRGGSRPRWRGGGHGDPGRHGLDRAPAQVQEAQPGARRCAPLPPSLALLPLLEVGGERAEREVLERSSGSSDDSQSHTLRAALCLPVRPRLLQQPGLERQPREPSH